MLLLKVFLSDEELLVASCFLAASWVALLALPTQTAAHKAHDVLHEDVGAVAKLKFFEPFYPVLEQLCRCPHLEFFSSIRDFPVKAFQHTLLLYEFLVVEEKNVGDYERKEADACKIANII